jgi:outer membrane protein TolC
MSMPRRSFAWAVAGVLSLSPVGCALFHADAPAAGLGQRILPPPDLASFHPDDTSAPPANPSEELPKPREWPSADATRPAGALTLEQAIALALDSNPSLEAMAERIAQAEGGKQVSFADFLPQASLYYRHIEATPSEHPFALPTIPTAIGNVAYGTPSDRFDALQLSVQWTLWDFGRTAGKFGQAVTALDIARLQYLRARQTVVFNVTAAYWTVLQTRAAFRVAEEAVRRAGSDLRDARNFLKRGTAIRNDVLRAETFLAETQLALVRARTAERVAVAALNQAIGINVNAPTRVADRTAVPGFRLELADCLQRAVDNRDEFAVVLRTIRSARLGAGVAQADFLPKIYVGGDVLHQATAAQRDANLATAGLNIELGLFEGGRRLGRLRTAEADVRIALARARDICDRIAYEVSVAYFAIDDARQRIDLARTAVAQATENLRVVRNLIEKGDATPTDVIDAELALTRAQQNEYTALYDYQTALARLAYAIGVTGPDGLVTPGGGPCRE